MSLYAGDVQIPQTLTNSISGIGTAGYNKIGSNYATARKGLPANSQYATQRFGAAQGLDVGGLESALGGGLGDASYKDRLSQRDYDQKAQLAEEAARLNKPSLLEQIFQGIGAIGKPAAQFAGMSKHGGNSSNYSMPNTSSGDSYNPAF